MNEQQVKAKFFAMYLWQKVFMMPDWESFNDNQPMEVDYSYLVANSHYLNNGYLQLRSIADLTDGEYIEVGKIFYPNTFQDIKTDQLRKYGKDLVNIFNPEREHNLTGAGRTIQAFQYLLSIGILLPFTYLGDNNEPTTLTPIALITKGWAVLAK